MACRRVHLVFQLNGRANYCLLFPAEKKFQGSGITVTNPWGGEGKRLWSRRGAQSQPDIILIAGRKRTSAFYYEKETGRWKKEFESEGDAEFLEDATIEKGDVLIYRRNTENGQDFEITIRDFVS